MDEINKDFISKRIIEANKAIQEYYDLLAKYENQLEHSEDYNESEIAARKKLFDKRIYINYLLVEIIGEIEKNGQLHSINISDNLYDITKSRNEVLRKVPDDILIDVYNRTTNMANKLTILSFIRDKNEKEKLISELRIASKRKSKGDANVSR